MYLFAIKLGLSNDVESSSHLLQLTFDFEVPVLWPREPAYFWRIIAARFNDMRSARYFNTCSGKPSANGTRNWRVGVCARARGKGYQSECRRVTYIGKRFGCFGVRLLMAREDPVEIPLRSSGVELVDKKGATGIFSRSSSPRTLELVKLIKK